MVGSMMLVFPRVVLHGLLGNDLMIHRAIGYSPMPLIENHPTSINVFGITLMELSINTLRTAPYAGKQHTRSLDPQ